MTDSNLENARKGAGRGLIALVLTVPVLSLIAAAAALVFVHERYQKSEGVARAEQVAQYELKRLTAFFNYRLNELREELLHLYGEQSNLARALNESERERLIFFRRDHLAAYAVLVNREGGEWDVQKYFLRESGTRSADQNKDLIKSFKDAMQGLKPPGFWIRRVDAKLFGAPWQGSDGYAVAFLSEDDAGKPFGLVGVFKPSSVFPFCKFFSEGLGLMPEAAFVLDERGFVVCHSQARFEGASFRDYAFYSAVRAADGPSVLVRYTNILGAEASAAVRKVEPGGLIFVGEAAWANPWSTAVPYRDLGVSAAAVALLSLLASIFAAGRVSRLARARSGAAPGEGDAETPHTDALGVELGEFTKLRHEVRDLEATVLEMQSSYAFIAGLQHAASELPLDADLGKLVVDHLAEWGRPVKWLSRAAAALEPFKLDLGRDGGSIDVSQEGELLQKLRGSLGLESLHVQPVHFAQELQGLLVVADAKPGHKDLLPHIAQIFATVAAARSARGATVHPTAGGTT